MGVGSTFSTKEIQIYFKKKSPLSLNPKVGNFHICFFFFSLCFSFLGTPQTSWANGLRVVFFGRNKHTRDWEKDSKLCQVNKLCQCHINWHNLCHIKWHNLCHNSLTCYVVNSRRVSSHELTITPLQLTTHHVSKLWHKHNSRLAACCNYIYIYKTYNISIYNQKFCNLTICHLLIFTM